MVEAEAGQNSHALVEYNSKTPDNNVAMTSTNLHTPHKNVPHAIKATVQKGQ